MKAFFKYLRHRLKHSTLQSCIFALISILFVIVQLPGFVTPTEYGGYIEATYGKEWQYHLSYVSCKTGMYLLAIVLGVFSTLIPILELSGLKKRRNLDALYSFPISRLSLSLAHFISGYIQVIFIYTCAFISSYAYLALNTDIFDLSYMLEYYPLSLAVGIIIYAFFAFLFTVANTVTDGVIISGLWVLVTHSFFYTSNIPKYLLLSLLGKIFPHESYMTVHSVESAFKNWSQIYSPLDKLTFIYQERAEINNDLSYDYKEIIDSCYIFVFWAVVGILCMAGYFIASKRHTPNKSGEISNSVLGYKLLLPLLILLLYRYFADIIYVLAILIFIGYVIYRRSFRLKLQDYIIFFASFVIANYFFSLFYYHYY